MRHKTTEALYSYWNALRGQRMAPRRVEIEPGGIGDILPDTFILERLDAGTFSYRLAGTRMCERFGREFRTLNFLDSWTPEHRQTLQDRLNTISVQGGAALLVLEASNTAGKSVPMEMIILPLLHNQAYADRFLGAVSVLQNPNWLGYEPIEACRLVSSEILWPDGTPSPAVEAQDRQTPFLPHIRRARIVRQDRRQFRVFDGGLAGTPPSTPPDAAPR